MVRRPPSLDCGRDGIPSLEAGLECELEYDPSRDEGLDFTSNEKISRDGGLDIVPSMSSDSSLDRPQRHENPSQEDLAWILAYVHNPSDLTSTNQIVP